MSLDPCVLPRQAIQAALAGDGGSYLPDQLGAWWPVYRELVKVPQAQRADVFAVLDHDRQLTALLAADSANSANTASDGWGQIVPFGQYDLPTFPVDALPPWLRAMVAAESQAKQTPLDLAALLALAVLSTCCARRVVVQPRPGWIEPLNLYTLTALPPGNRKSPVFAAMTAPLVQWERRQAAALQGEVAAAVANRRVIEAQLQRAESEAARASGKDAELSARADVDTLARDLAVFVVPSIPRLIVDDITPEMLGSLLCQHDGRIAVLSPEGDIFNIMAGRYSQGSPNLAIYLKGHAGDTIRIDRRTRTEYVERPALTLGLTVQPEVLRSLGQKGEFRGLGLLGRFFYAMPSSLVGSRDPEAPPVPQMVARIAGLLHLAGGFAAHEPVAEETVAQAIAVGQYAIPHARAAYAEVGADPAVTAAAHVLSWLSRSELDSFTRRDAFEGTKGRFKKVADLDPALELLADHGYIRLRLSEERPGPGRKPSPTYDVHPTFASSHNSHNSRN